MPIEKRHNTEGQLVDRYVPPFVMRTTDVSESDLDVVREHRRNYAGQVEALHKMQKEFAAQKDYSSAKELKELIKHFTQSEKCATLVINYFDKLASLNTADWPQELYEFLDYEFNAIDLGQYERSDNA